MRTIKYSIDEAHDGTEVGRFLQGKGYSRALLTVLKQNNGLWLNDRHIRTVDPMRCGDTLEVVMRDVSDAPANPELSAPVLYDDEDIVVFDKPANMPVHTSIWHGHDTLANLFSALYPDCYFHSVGRLDKDTSGLVAVAKNKLAASLLMTDVYEERPKKVYYALTSRAICDEFGDCGEIIAPIARDKDNYVRRTVRDDGEYAHTRFRTVERGERYCLHEVTLFTGRTHQIRVHFAYIGYPLVGDSLYGGDTSVLKRQALHCGRLDLDHPITKEHISVTSSLPEDMSILLCKKSV